MSLRCSRRCTSEWRRPTSTDRGFRGGTDPLERLGLGEASTARRQECLRYIRFAGGDFGKGPLQCEPGCTVPGNHLLAAILRGGSNEKSSSCLASVGCGNGDDACSVRSGRREG